MSDNVIEDMDRLFLELQRRMRKRTIVTKMATLVRNIIYIRVKDGFGVNDDTLDPKKTREEKFAVLSPGYIRARRSYVKSGRRLGHRGAITKPNLTFTGQLLNSLGYELTSEGFKITVGKEKRAFSDISNADLAGFLRDKDRKFLALTRNEFKLLENLFNQLLAKEIRRLFV